VRPDTLRFDQPTLRGRSVLDLALANPTLPTSSHMDSFQHISAGNSLRCRARRTALCLQYLPLKAFPRRSFWSRRIVIATAVVAVALVSGSVPCGRPSWSFPQRSSYTYSCCASRMIRVRLGPEPTTNSEPVTPGTMVMNEIVPSGFLRLATSLFHSPKSKIVEGPDMLTVISPSDALL